jgi:3-dehydroquinate synthase
MLHQTVPVALGDRSYQIRIADTLEEAIAFAGTQNAMLVSDSNVAPLYAERVDQLLRRHGVASTLATIPAGESSKSFSQLETLCSAAVTAGLDRRSACIALGGGVVGDLAGYMAASYQRGITFVQIPTSLLAMVDSSVGGKTAVNLPQAKNMVGAFYQPVEVAIALETLQTLPEREYRSGLGEVIKYGVIHDAAFFAQLEADAARLLDRDPATLAKVVARCCTIKADVVSRDETEGGLRAILNFGHTFGHAVEATCGYGVWLHGEAIAIGMVYAAALSVSQQGLNAAVATRITTLLERVGLPVKLAADSPSWERLRSAMSADKKSQQRVPRWVLADRLGHAEFGVEIPEEAMQAAHASVQP